MNTSVTDDHDQQARSKSRWSPWLIILSGPIAWTLQIIIGYGFVPYACDHGTKSSLYILAVIAALLTVAAGVVAWRQWGLVSKRTLTELAEPKESLSFLTAFGILMSLLFFGLIALTGIAAMLSSPCPFITMKLP